MKKSNGYIWTILTGLLLIIFSGFIAYWCGYFTGWLGLKFLGNRLVNSFGIIFHTEMTESKVKLICAGIAFIASQFNFGRKYNNNNKSSF